MNLLNVTKDENQEIVRVEIKFDLPGNQFRDMVAQTQDPGRFDYVGSIHVFDNREGFIIISMKTGDDVVNFIRIPRIETNYVCRKK